MKKQNKKSEVQVAIEDDGETPLPVEIMQKHIAALSDGLKRALNGKVKEEVFVLLLHDATKVSKPAIREILRALERLKEMYCR